MEENEEKMGARSLEEFLSPKNKERGIRKMGVRRKKPSLSPKRREKTKENEVEMGAREEKMPLPPTDRKENDREGKFHGRQDKKK